ncbi:MAG: VWA domain-containing protein [Planctomycetota bacterium]|nr:VWA domain-containing protein [Planctomycetota bacterium]
MPIYFEQPGWLLLALLLIPSWWWLRRSREAFGPGRWILIGLTRSVLILVLAVAMAEPILQSEARGLTVAVVVDRSRSIPRSGLDRATDWLEQAANGPGRQLDDRLAVIQVGRDAVPTAMPDPASVISLNSGPADVTETNLAQGIELAKGLFPRDTASRIVLLSDGNETIGSLEIAADMARESGIPIDVLPIEYAYQEEVLFDRLLAPSHARRGQSLELRLVLRSRGPASGRLVLEQDGALVDINGGLPGHALPLTLEGGLHVERITVESGNAGPVQFRATFEPDPGAGDRIAANNSAAAVTMVSGSGSVLIIDDGIGGGSALEDALTQAGITFIKTMPSGMNAGVVGMLGYDMVALVGVPRWSMTELQVRDLHAYVHDTGGGLLVTGGPEGLGAGGWIGSALESAIPLELDPPAERQIVKGALAIIVHSCEMPQGNYWGQRVTEAAIETLNAADEIGIIEKGAGDAAKWVLPMQVVGNRQAALSAARKLTFGDMQMFEPSMQTALQSLLQVDAGQRHVIIISDGDPAPPSSTLISQYADNNVSCSTVMVGGHGNNPMHAAIMQRIASMTGGSFYRVEDPQKLPQIFIKEARVVSRSLIQEGNFPTTVTERQTGPLQGIDEVPGIKGYVLTAPREGLARVGIVVTNDTNGDPLYAWWNYGLGRVSAFTSDLSTRWVPQWLAWPRFSAFWEQSTRWLMRSSSMSDFTMNIKDEGGGQFIVDLTALDADTAFLNFLKTRAVVIAPDGTTSGLDLQQMAPGHYRGEFQQSQAGTSVVNVNFAGRDADGEVLQGNVQAAVSRAYSDEYRDLVDNAIMLRRVAERTGGRVLSMDEVLPVDLFDRESLVMPSTARAIWMTLAILAAILLVLDVGLRRLAVDPERVREALAKASARRDRKGDASLSAWRRTKRAARSRTTMKPEPSSPVDPGQQETAGGSGKPDVTKPSRQAKSPPKEDQEDGMTSRLKAARDRARQQGLGDTLEDDES